MRKALSVIIIWLSFNVMTAAQEAPKREFRGAWIQTIYQDEYARMRVEELKADFLAKLDALQSLGINAVIFQVRPEADAWYASELEPWSRFLTGAQGKAPEPFFDPMAFLVRECHRRGMEFHAWLNPFRAGTAGTENLADSHVYHDHPEWFVTYGKLLLFDPGVPACREHICRVVRDIVYRYDVDAIHMDDYFYPYPVGGQPFPDDESFRTYGIPAGYAPEERDDWRRENVNQLIRSLQAAIKGEKPWVRFGISPFGIYRNQSSDPDGSRTNGLQNYDDLYADVTLWTREGWIDYCVPQLYWEIGHKLADYATLVDWWDAHAGAAHLYIGQDVARTAKADDLTHKMSLSRTARHARGNCFWPANELLRNTGGIADSLRERYHRYPALIPAYTNLHKGRPRRVCDLKQERTSRGVTLKWMTRGGREIPTNSQYFVIYRFARGERVRLDDPSKILGTTRYTECYLPATPGKYHYAVTAVDRYHNESKARRVKVKIK